MPVLIFGDRLVLYPLGQIVVDDDCCFVDHWTHFGLADFYSDDDDSAGDDSYSFADRLVLRQSCLRSG